MRYVDEMGRPVYETPDAERSGGGGGWAWLFAVTFLVIIIAMTAGCGGSKRARPPAPPPVPVPTVRPERHAVACWSYVYGATVDDLAAMRASGITAVMDYDQRGICERTAASAMAIVFPFYFGGGGTPAELERIARDQARNVAACSDRVVALYPADEPEHRGVADATIEAMIASAARELPHRPSLITFTEKSRLPTYAGLTYRGAELYSRLWRDMREVRRRIADAGIVAVPRAFDNGGRWWGKWTDGENATFITQAAAELRTGPATTAIFYTFADNLTDGKRDTGWRDLPLTRAAIADVCR